MTAAQTPVWEGVAASCTGSSHLAAGAANQDAYATLTAGSVTVVAVADGHGHPSHFRSAHGARVAVDLAVSLAVEAAGLVDDARALGECLEEQVKPQLLRDWKRRVLDHAGSVPFASDVSEQMIASGDEAVLRTYGTTLIALVGTTTGMGFAQIGDGDAIAVFTDGEVIRPLPEDPQLDGIHTTSLSQRDASKSLRVAVLDLDERQLRLALAVTDGFAAPQVDGVGWWRQVGYELATHLNQHGSSWICEKLPSWLAEPAKTGGDDTTMGLLLNSAQAATSDRA